jgi:hypothetical protein
MEGVKEGGSGLAATAGIADERHGLRLLETTNPVVVLSVW